MPDRRAVACGWPALPQAPVSGAEFRGFLAHVCCPLALPGGEHPDVILFGFVLVGEAPVALL